MKIVGILNANAAIDAAVAGPIPGNIRSCSGDVGKTPLKVDITWPASSWRYLPRRLYPSPCQQLKTSRNVACAKKEKEGNVVINISYFGSTRYVCVCCNITSEITTL